MRLPCVLASALVLTGCNVQVGEDGISVDVSDARARDEWVRTYELAPGATVEIVNANGEIEATRAPGRQVEVRAEREVRSRDEEAAKGLLRSVDMQERVAADGVRIEARSPETEPGRRPQLVVRYRVSVPAGVAVTLKTESGGVRLQDLSGAVTASTVTGGITGRNLFGAVSADVVNGGIQMDFASIGGDVDLSTINGGIRLDLPAGGRAALDLNCVNGGIDLDGGLEARVSESSQRRVVATLNGGGARVSAETVNGGIRVRRRPDTRASE